MALAKSWTKQTEESKRVGEILKGLKLSDANPEGNSIPDKLHDTQVDIRVVVGEKNDYYTLFIVLLFFEFGIICSYLDVLDIE
jgi:hypothetical protein